MQRFDLKHCDLILKFCYLLWNTVKSREIARMVTHYRHHMGME